MVAWEADNESTLFQYKDNIRSNLLYEIRAFQKFDEIRRRTPQEWRLLYLRRFVIILLCISVLGAGVFGVGYVTLYSNDVTTYIQNLSWLPDWAKGYASLVPTLAVTGVVGIAPYIVRASTALEGWDFENEEVDQQILRTYIVSVANYYLVIWIEFQKISGINIF